MVGLPSARAPHAQHGGPTTAADRGRDTHAGGRADHLLAAFESAADGVLVLDDDRRCIDINRAACDLLGIARAGLVGQRFDTFAPTGCRERVTGGWSAFQRDGLAAGEFATAAPNGSGVLVGFTLRARVTAGRHLLVLRDITATRSAEVARGNLAAMLERSEDAICICSHEGVLLSWNRGAEKLYGFTAAEAIGRSIAMLLPAADRVTRESWERAWGGEPVEPFETVRITKDGRSVIVAVTVTTITDVFGTATGVGEIARDVTEQKYAQAALSATQAKAVESSEVQAQFIASMNHELRVPLSGVIGIGRLLENTTLDPQQREYVQALRVSSEGLASAIEAILDFSRLETSTLELSDERYDLRALVEDVCSVVSLGASSSEIEVLSHLEPDLPAILHGDEQRVRQVLTTLLVNAVKLTRAGDVCVSARVAAHAGAPYALVEVLTGEVIDFGRLAAVGAALAPAGRSAPRAADTEFGLTIAKRLVAMMGGEVRVESSAGERSSLSFTLPLRGDPAAPENPTQPDLKDVRVLVVCANATSQQLVVRQLRNWNARVWAAADHDQALSALRTAAQADDPFAAALIDHRDSRTTTLDAPALVCAIRSDDSLHSTRTVVLVAPHDVSDLAGIPTDGLIRKPAGQTRVHGELTRVIASPPRGADGATPSAEQPKPPGSSGRVLVAEDNAVNRLVAVHLLEQRGFVVDVANDGREAIVMHAHNIYDAIFMDCQMPEINGYEATREIRRREGTKRHTTVIAMTASTLASDRERCLAAGMDHHIGKPVRPSAVDHVLARAIASKPA